NVPATAAMARTRRLRERNQQVTPSDITVVFVGEFLAQHRGTRIGRAVVAFDQRLTMIPDGNAGVANLVRTVQPARSHRTADGFQLATIAAQFLTARVPGCEIHFHSTLTILQYG